jgi:far upstream element-binding protein
MMQGGETIKSMQSDTGCKINVSQASGADIEREIGLVGSRQAIDDAKRAIWEKVDQVVCSAHFPRYVDANESQREKNNNRRRDNGNGNGTYDNYSQQQQPPAQAYGGPPAAQPPATAPIASNPAGNVADPYAVYGGYQNYLAMWYASIAQQQQGQPGQPPQGPPGA